MTSWPPTSARRSCMPNRPSPRSRERIMSSTSKPSPSSATAATTSSGPRQQLDPHRRWAPACLATLVSASWTTRYSTSSTCGGRRAVAIVETLGAERHAHRHARAVRVRVALQGGHQAQIVERRGAQLDGQLAHGFERFGGQLAQLVDLAAHFWCGARLLEDLQANQQRGQRLGGLVVQLAGDALALVLLGRQHLLGHLLQQPAVLAAGRRASCSACRPGARRQDRGTARAGRARSGRPRRPDRRCARGRAAAAARASARAALISTLPAKPTTSITATAGQWMSPPLGLATKVSVNQVPRPTPIKHHDAVGHQHLQEQRQPEQGGAHALAGLAGHWAALGDGGDGGGQLDCKCRSAPGAGTRISHASIDRY